jgi:xanthine dehydrogenase iron-sulfur cluster and FAD-binding subunit A
MMINFQYVRANDVADAIRLISADPAAKIIAAGTNLVDLMNEDVERPSRLIDISRLPLKAVEKTAQGGLRIGRAGPRIPTSPITRSLCNIIPCSRARSWRARRNRRGRAFGWPARE